MIGDIKVSIAHSFEELGLSEIPLVYAERGDTITVEIPPSLYWLAMCGGLIIRYTQEVSE